MKKFFTGIICIAAIMATSVVFLPAAALMTAVRLSKHPDDSRKYCPHAGGERYNGFLTEQYKMEGRLR